MFLSCACDGLNGEWKQLHHGDWTAKLSWLAGMVSGFDPVRNSLLLIGDFSGLLCCRDGPVSNGTLPLFHHSL